MNQQSHQRIGKEANIDKAQKRIRNLFNLDIIDNVQTRKSQFIKQNHPDPRQLISEGYVVHSLPLRTCDFLKIHNYPKLTRSYIPTTDDKSPLRTNTQIARIMTSAKKQRGLNITLDDNSTIIAELPAFYTKNQSNSRPQRSLPTNANIAIRIRSFSRVTDICNPSKIYKFKSSTPYKSKRKSLHQYLLNNEISVNSFIYEN